MTIDRTLNLGLAPHPQDPLICLSLRCPVSYSMTPLSRIAASTLVLALTAMLLCTQGVRAAETR